MIKYPARAGLCAFSHFSLFPLPGLQGSQIQINYNVYYHHAMRPTEHASDNLHSTTHLFQPSARIYYNFIQWHLYFTMYLFQLAITDMSDNANKIFTFHYVSISTTHGLSVLYRYLHLHSTMYLFQLNVLPCIFIFKIVFTFHYVSISTTKIAATNGDKKAFTFHYVSISTIR